MKLAAAVLRIALLLSAILGPSLACAEVTLFSRTFDTISEAEQFCFAETPTPNNGSNNQNYVFNGCSMGTAQWRLTSNRQCKSFPITERRNR